MPKDGQDARWRKYVEAYGSWLLWFMPPRVPMTMPPRPKASDGHVAQSDDSRAAIDSPLARVRAVFLCCDLKKALRPYIEHLGQEAKMRRLHDLIQAMLLWTTATNSDPTRSLYEKVGFQCLGPNDEKEAAMSGKTRFQTFLLENSKPPKRIDDMLQLRMLLHQGTCGRRPFAASVRVTTATARSSSSPPPSPPACTRRRG